MTAQVLFSTASVPPTSEPCSSVLESATLLLLQSVGHGVVSGQDVKSGQEMDSGHV